MAGQKKDTPGVIAPPPLIFLSGLLAGGLVQWFYPVRFWPPEYLLLVRIAGGLLIIAGLAVILIAKIKMGRVKTSIEPWKPTTAILTDGIYACSRNPVYVAMVIIYLGTVLVFDSVWLWPGLVPVLIVMHYGVIRREEEYLERKFGEEYMNYLAAVRRWI